MKKLLFLMMVVALVSCGNNGTESANSVDASADSSLNGPVTVDSSTSNSMNADTTGMSNAR